MEHTCKTLTVSCYRCGLNADELRQQIADISDEMKGPMSNLERALLHADRKDMKEALRKFEAAQTA